jgi:hypothetical protein
VIAAAVAVVLIAWAHSLSEKELRVYEIQHATEREVERVLNPIARWI